jgi:putative oxidoreductase
MNNCSFAGAEKGKGKIMVGTGLLIARLIVGLAMAAHGAQKAFGFFGGHGLKATSGFFESLGYRPGVLFAASAAYGEIVGGILTALGLFGPVGPALIVLLMIVAAGSVHLRNGFFASGNGVELNAFYVAASLALAFAGPGVFSFDTLAGLDQYFSAQVDAVVVGAGIVVGFLSLAIRRTTASAASPSASRPGA